MRKSESCLVTCLLALLSVSCVEQDGVNRLFSGTLPMMEVSAGDSVRITDPQSLFITLLSDEVEYGGSIYPLTRLSEEAAATTYSASFPLAPGVVATRITFMQPDSILVLGLAGTDREVRMELFDRMIRKKADAFIPVDLTADIGHLSGNQKAMLKILFRVADLMDEIYWEQVFPDREAALASMINPDVVRFFRINYGPWERLNGNLPFLPGYGPKPSGSGFYPHDMSRAEFEALEDPDKTSLYTMIRRNPEGELISVPYHVAYASRVEEAASLLREAADLAENEGFRNYLTLRARALLTDDYLESDLAWMDMRDNDIDFVVGPIENYEDALYNYKAAHESFILIKDREWSEKLAYVNSILPEMQKSLPVPPEYKREVPGSNSDLGAYDVVYYAGDCNAGSKTIAINLPNDERVHEAKGSRKLQLKNAIRYKFEEILVPISNVLIDESQREHVTFEAFFENTMYHEVAHGLGINQTLDGMGTVRSALKEQYSALEEGKADVLGLFLITRMHEMGILGERDLMDNYVTFMASIFRSIRFGVASSHGKANMIRFYYFQEMDAFTRNETDGTYRIDFQRMQHAMNELARRILMMQGDGDYEGARTIVEDLGYIRQELQADLDRLKELSIPVDITFNQGPDQLGL